ncbi:MAG: helix-turn-helix domain-containing protein [Atopostipes sp.]|nr:helix-turn-helix domain-containing protein [Atopostipes sp.]
MTIGDIIKKEREKLRMTQKELSEGICSEKYIYLIEKNERNPSAFILKDLNERLGINLFDYYDYKDYENNELIVEHREKFDHYTENSDIFSLKEEALKAEKLKEFQVEPLLYDVQMIHLSYKINVEGKVKEGIEGIKRILTKEELVIETNTLINFYVLLSTAYQIEGEWEKARTAIEKSYPMIKNKTRYNRYNTTVISAFISYAALLFNQKDYERLLDIAHELKRLHNKYSRHNRVYYVHFYLAYAYFENDEVEKARESYMEGIHSALLFKNIIDLKVILQFEGIEELAVDLDIHKRYFQQIQEVVDQAEKDQ